MILRSDTLARNWNDDGAIQAERRWYDVYRQVNQKRTIDIWIFPVNQRNVHWYLLLFQQSTGIWAIADSNRRRDKHAQHYQKDLETAIDVLTRAYNVVTHQDDIPFPASTFFWENAWIQEDGHSCGIYLVQHVLYLLRSPRHLEEVLTNEHIPPPMPRTAAEKFRKTMFTILASSDERYDPYAGDPSWEDAFQVGIVRDLHNGFLVDLLPDGSWGIPYPKS